ncbi:MAG: NADH-quinone oxidoreductase subunit C [Magnetococcales bacterium]|nr:NADH-quinone oxidoreductase subunit C [Magnetococcales bacterium]
MTSEKLDRLQMEVAARLPGFHVERLADALVVHVTIGSLLSTMARLRDDIALDFKLLVDLAGVHYPDREIPFELVYQLLSVHHNHRIRVKLSVKEGELVPSVARIWSCADWYEREAYDMFGILFSGHTDLRRILNDYDFHGYPLRKDFPVVGLVESRYDAVRGMVVKEPVRLGKEDREPFRQSP